MAHPGNSSTYAIKEAAELLLIVVVSLVLCRGFGWPFWLAAVAAMAKALSSLVFYRLLLRRPFGRSPCLRADALVGRQGLVLTPLAPTGQIRVGNEIWKARSRRADSIGAGQSVRIVEVDRLLAWVEPLGDSE